MNPPNKQIQTVITPLMRCVSTFDGSRTSAAGYKLIPLTQGLSAIVDIDKYEWLNQYKWYALKGYNTYYAIRKFEGKLIAMHRAILGLTLNDGKEVDHKNRNGLDNRMANIRICAHAQNIQNSHKINQSYSSKYKDVYYDKIQGKWRACINANKKRYRLGRYRSEVKAAKAYDTRALELHGEYAYTNFLASGLRHGGQGRGFYSLRNK